MTQAEPAMKPIAAPAAHSEAGHVTVPPVSPPVNAPPEYLLTPPVPPGSGPTWRAAQEEVLREAAFRYLFAHSSNTRRLPVYYLSVGGFPWEQGAEGNKDPEAEFLARFRGCEPPVQAVSALPVSSKNWNNPVKHHWIIFRVSSIKWASDTKVKIACGSAQSGYKGSDNLYWDCILRDGRWRIIGVIEVST